MREDECVKREKKREFPELIFLLNETESGSGCYYNKYKVALATWNSMGKGKGRIRETDDGEGEGWAGRCKIRILKEEGTPPTSITTINALHGTVKYAVF